jgi:putative ABC transport system permease protein
LPADHADPIEILPEFFKKNSATPVSDLPESRELIRSVIAGNDKFLASEALARRLRLSPGDEVTIAVSAAGGSRSMSGTVAAIVRDYSSELGFLFMGKSTYEAATGLDGCHSLRIYTRGIPANEFATKLNAQLPSVAAALDISSSQSLKANALAVFEQTFKVTGILTFLAATLGGIALVVQIAQATASRRLEWLALRRLGTSWQGMARLVAADVFLSIAAGVILGTACGWILGWLLVTIVNRQAFGWTILMGGPQSVGKTIAFSAFYGAILWGSGVLIGWWTMRPGAKWNVRRE